MVSGCAIGAIVYSQGAMEAVISIITPLFGGVLIGLATVLLLVSNGRLAGVSGILARSLELEPGPMQLRDLGWRWAFLAGLVSVGLIASSLVPAVFEPGIERSLPALAVAGLLVGYGTQLGGGCTSGHGVCGNSRLAVRSMVATLVFIATGAVTVAVVNRIAGGVL